MIPFVKKIARGALQRAGLHANYSLWKKGYLHEVGWPESWRSQQPIDKEGNPLPWLSYPAIHFLEQRIQPHFCVFEYGIGFSTLWWAKRVQRVVGCDHDRGWIERIRARAPSNVRLIHEPSSENGGYAHAALALVPLRFDVIVIDGEDRNHCARHAMPALTSGGVVLWDNSERPEYVAGFAELAQAGFRKLSFAGMCPVINTLNETSLFYRPDNVLGI